MPPTNPVALDKKISNTYLVLAWWSPLQISANNGHINMKFAIVMKKTLFLATVIVGRRQGPIFTKKLAKSAKKLNLA